MGRIKGHFQKNIYSKFYSNDLTQQTNKIKNRRIIPKFDKLFLTNAKAIDEDLSPVENETNLINSFTKKVNGYTATCYSPDIFASSSSTSGNETFDRLVKVEKSNIKNNAPNIKENKEFSSRSSQLNNDSSSSSSLSFSGSSESSSNVLFATPKLIYKKLPKEKDEKWQNFSKVHNDKSKNVQKHQANRKLNLDKSIILKNGNISTNHNKAKSTQSVNNIIYTQQSVDNEILQTQLNHNKAKSTQSVNNIIYTQQSVDNEILQTQLNHNKAKSTQSVNNIIYTQQSVDNEILQTQLAGSLDKTNETRQNQVTTRANKIKQNIVITSTPAIREKEKEQAIMISDVSPVEKEDSFSSYDDSLERVNLPNNSCHVPNLGDDVNHLSNNPNCDISLGLCNRMRNCYISQQGGKIFHVTPRTSYQNGKSTDVTPKSRRPSLLRKIPQCYLLLNRFEPKTNKFNNSINSTLSSNNSLYISTKSNLSTYNYRKNILENYTNKRRKKFNGHYQPSFLFSSDFSKKYISGSLHKTDSKLDAAYQNSRNKSCISYENSENQDEFYSLSKSLANLSINLKGGKGWRRSIKKSMKFVALKDASFKDILSQLNNSALICDSINEETKNWKNIILNLCNQTEFVSFDDCFSEGMYNSSCKKIGEGIYGEVFMTFGEQNNINQKSVWKIMPIEGELEVNGEPQKSYEEIAPEIIVSLELSKLATDYIENKTEVFVRFIQCVCVRGCYSKQLLNLWDKYNEEKGSENDRPDIFCDNQIYMILQFEFAGMDLESYVFNNAFQAYSLFIQIAGGLAVAEEELDFEHRDLHWGNVLVAPTSETVFDLKFKGKTHTIKTGGVKATIIDFTLSRLCIDGQIYFNDLSKDPSMFSGQGDYQFDVYRLMKKANRNNWKNFFPVTNIYWLNYIILKMIDDCYYKNKLTKIHKKGLTKLKETQETIMNYTSVSKFIYNLEEFS